MMNISAIRSKNLYNDEKFHGKLKTHIKHKELTKTEKSEFDKYMDKNSNIEIKIMTKLQFRKPHLDEII